MDYGGLAQLALKVGIVVDNAVCCIGGEIELLLSAPRAQHLVDLVLGGAGDEILPVRKEFHPRRCIADLQSWRRWWLLRD